MVNLGRRAGASGGELYEKAESGEGWTDLIIAMSMNGPRRLR